MMTMAREERGSDKEPQHIIWRYHGLDRYIAYDVEVYGTETCEDESRCREEEKEDEEERYFKRFIPIWDAMVCGLKDSSPYGNPIATYALIVLNIVISFTYFGCVANKDCVLSSLPNSICILNGDCIATVVLAMFVHGNILHLLFNMVFLYIFGDNVELTIGRWRFLLLYFISGLTGFYIQSLYTIAYDSQHMFYALVGASSAISGLIGAYILLYPGATLCMCYSFFTVARCYKVKATTLVGLWIMMQFIYFMLFTSISGLSIVIAIWAHLAGFITGYSLTWITVNKNQIMELRKSFARGMYKGLKVRDEELRQYSLSGWIRALVILVVLLIASMTISSTESIVKLDNKYAMLYDYYSKSYYVKTICHITIYAGNKTIKYDMVYPGKNVNCMHVVVFTSLYMIEDGNIEGGSAATVDREVVKVPVYRYHGLQYKIVEKYPENMVYENKTNKIVVYKVYSLSNVYETTQALILISLVLLAITSYISLTKYKEFEVTYIGGIKVSEIKDNNLFYEEHGSSP